MPNVECANCGWTGDAEDADVCRDFWSRVEPGETVPHGDCPKCGAFCYGAAPPATSPYLNQPTLGERERRLVDMLKYMVDHAISSSIGSAFELNRKSARALLAECDGAAPRAARDVPPGASWAFGDHRSLAEADRGAAS